MYWHELLEGVGECILCQRKSLRLSQHSLAIQAFVDIASLRRIERGQVNPNLKVLNKITRVLQTSLYDVCCRAEKDQPNGANGSLDSF